MLFSLSELRVALVELLRVAPVKLLRLAPVELGVTMSSFQISKFLKIFSNFFFKILFLLLGYFKDIRRLLKSYVIRINILEVIVFLLLKMLIPYNPLPTY